MLASLDNLTLGGLIEAPMAQWLLRAKPPSLKSTTAARLRGRPAGEETMTEPFYSQVRTVLEDPKTQGTQTGEAWAEFLTDPKRGVKAEEMKWTGLGEFLKSKAGERVTREQIQSHLDANEIQVKEVTKGPGRMLGHDMQGEPAWGYRESPEELTKFSSYTLPGAENYREVLLTMPQSSPAKRRSVTSP